MMPIIKRIILVSTLLTALSVTISYLGLSFPKPVFASQLIALEEDIYTDRLERTQKELRQYKIEEFRMQQSDQPVPEFIKVEQLELEDKIKDLEKKLDEISEEKGKA